MVGEASALPPALHAAYSSWLNQVERLFAELTNKAIRRGSFHSVKKLERAIAEHLDARVAKPFVGGATADEILEKMRRCCVRTSRSGP